MAPRAKAGTIKQQKAERTDDGGEPPAPPKAQQQKRKRAAPVSTASTLQTKTLFASTRDELREIQTELEELAQERRRLIEADATGRKAVLPLLPPSEKKSCLSIRTPCCYTVSRYQTLIDKQVMSAERRDDDTGDWRSFQTQLLQCWVGEAIACVVERFAAVAAASSSHRIAVTLLSLLSNDDKQQKDATAFAHISAFVKRFLEIQHKRHRRNSSGGGATACGNHGGELCIGGVADADEFKLWLQQLRHHEQQSHHTASCLVVLYAPLLSVKTQEEIAQIVMNTRSMADTMRTLVLLINDPLGLIDSPSGDSGSLSSSCYRFIDSHTQASSAESSLSSTTAISSSHEQFLARPLTQLGVQCGLRFVMEIARWTVFASEVRSGGGDGNGNIATNARRPLPPPMLTSVSQMPFQLLLLALRWSHFHPTLVRAFASPFERKLRLIPQNRISSAISQLGEQESALWSHVYATEAPHDCQFLGAPAKRLKAELEDTTVVQIPYFDDNGTDLRRSLSQCHLWNVQKQFYLTQGIRAWSDGIIPFGVSSSSFLAAAYARVAVDFFLEAPASRPPVFSASSPNDVDAPNCFVWEAASGSCKFLHAFLVHFYQFLDQRELAVRGLRPCIVASDLSDQVLESRMEMACFEPFLRDGRLEFARFDTSAFVSGETRKQLLLRHSQRIWHVGRDGPVFLMGNYFFDSLHTDVFAVTRSPVNGGGAAALRVFEGRVDPQISSIADLDLSFQQIQPFEEPVYDDPFVNEVLLDVLECLVKSSSTADPHQPSSLILFPVEAIEFIRTLVEPTASNEDKNEVSNFPVGIMIGDASFSFRDPIPSAFFNQKDERFEIPQLSPHPDCFCLPIDFEILRVFLQRLASPPSEASVTPAITTSAQVASAIATDTFDVLYGRVCPQASNQQAQATTSSAPVNSSLSQVAFAHEFASFTPSDCDLLWGMMGVDDGAAHFSLKTQIALLAQSAWDFDLFVVLQWTLMRFFRSLVLRNSNGGGSSSDSEQLLRAQLIAIAKRCWQTYYVLDGDNDHALSLLQLCRWLYKLDAYDEVIALLAHNVKTTPDLEKNAGVCYLLALAFFHTADFWHALVFFRKCFAIAPKRIKFRRRIAQTLLALQKQKLKAGKDSGN